MSRFSAVLLLAAGLVTGCDRIFGRDIDAQTVEVACGTCIFKKPSAHGCYWAARIDGEVYAVNGPVPADHDGHGPEGMCTVPRRAVVSGEIRGEQLLATQFELLPFDPSTPRPEPAGHSHAH